MPREYTYTKVIFTDYENRRVRDHEVLVPYGSRWSAMQIVSVARLALKEYALRASVPDMGYNEIPEETSMSYEMNNQGFALWCSAGEHAFSPEDKNRKKLSITEYDDHNNAIDKTGYSCGPCSSKNSLLSKPAIAPAGADTEEYTRFLEWKAGLSQANDETGYLRRPPSDEAW